MLAIYAIPIIRICILLLSSYDQPFSMGYHGLVLKLPACESLQYCCQLTLYDCENIIPYLINNGIYAQFNPPSPGPYHHHHRIEWLFAVYGSLILKCHFQFVFSSEIL